MILEERECKEWTRGDLHVERLVWKDILGLLDPLEVRLHSLSVNVSHQLEKDVLIYCVLPRCTLLGFLAGPSG
jgi:hypothetical protein